jgi:HSP20 family molecular chaperone IbpA
MSHVAIARIHEGQEPSFLDEIKALTNRIRERAFALFQKRGSSEGTAIGDWLQAERDLTCATESDLVEKGSGFQLRVAVPGFAEKELKVTALPDALVVSAQSAHRHEEDEGKWYFCEFAEKQIYRRFELPKIINVDKVTARLEKGILQVTAEKAAA